MFRYAGTTGNFFRKVKYGYSCGGHFPPHPLSHFSLFAGGAEENDAVGFYILLAFFVDERLMS